MKGARKRRGSSEGFTLIELIVVITIIGILATAVVVNVIPRGREAMKKRVTSDFNQIESAISMYYLEYNQYPDSLDQLMNPPARLDGSTPESYLKNPPKDPWGNLYYYEYADGRIYLESWGEDGLQGTEDDIINRSEEEGARATEGYLTLPE